MADSRQKKSMSLSSSVQSGAQLADSRYKNKASLPNQHDNNASTLNKLEKSLYKQGDRPRGAWRNLASGIMTGLEHSEKSKSISERKGDFDKYDKSMEYLEEVNNSLIEKNQWYEEKAMEMEKVKPFATAGLEISYSGMDYDTGNERMRSVMEQAKLDNPNITGDYVGYVPNSPIVNMRDKDGNIKAISLSQFTGEDIVKRVQGSYLDRQKIAILREQAPEKNAIQREKLAETKRRNDQNAIKSDIKLSETLGKKIDSSREFLTIAPKMQQIVQEHPDIFQSAIDVAWRDSENPGFLKTALRKAQSTMSPEKVEALTKMTKYINKMTLDVANGFARPNMFIEKIGSKAVPNLDMSPEAFQNVLSEMVEENINSIKNNQARFDLLASDVETGISGQYRESTKKVMGDKSSTVVIVNPETGEQKTISDEYLDSAIAGGWEAEVN